MAMVVAGIISGYSATEICKTFIESTKSMVSSMLIVGFTRGILIFNERGHDHRYDRIRPGEPA